MLQVLVQFMLECGFWVHEFEIYFGYPIMNKLKHPEQVLHGTV